MLERCAWFVTALACASASCRPAEAPAPRLARVTINDVTVRPTKPGGAPWDGPGPTMTPEDAARLTEALGAPDPAREVTTLLAGPVFQAFDKPDIKGPASLFLRTEPRGSRTFRGQADSMTPTLRPKPSWDGVPLDGTARIEVELIDEDLAFDDPIGTFVIDAETLAAAAERGIVYQISVADQTRHSVLFVGITVVLER
jgi:hypothetical protein